MGAWKREGITVVSFQSHFSSGRLDFDCHAVKTILALTRHGSRICDHCFVTWLLVTGSDEDKERRDPHVREMKCL
jgi:hypothetical protein